jgi:ankyrin repeat protein
MFAYFIMFSILLMWLAILVMRDDVSFGKGIVKSLTQGNGDLSAIFSFNEDGLNALHFAARAGNLDVCKYMVEELGGDGNAPGFGALAEGRSLCLSSFFKLVAMFPSLRPVMLCIFSTGATPFMMSTHSGDVPTFIYFLDHGGDLMKTDDKGRTVLHHAVAKGTSPNTHTHYAQFVHVCVYTTYGITLFTTGSCKVTEFILSKGVPVDLDCGLGTPLFMAATNEQDKTVKLLLDHHANVYDLYRFLFLLINSHFRQIVFSLQTI